MINGAQRSHKALLLRAKVEGELREQWQCRLLEQTKDKTQKIAIAFISFSFEEAMDVLLHIHGLNRELGNLYRGPATIKAAGHIVCDYVTGSYTDYPNGARSFRAHRNALVYDSEDDLITEFRKLADKLKFSDDDRRDMFDAIKRWVSRDERIGPAVEFKK